MGGCASASRGISRSFRKRKDSLLIDSVESVCEGDENLLKLETRIVIPGSSKHCALHIQQGRKGINQDAMIVWEEFMLQDDMVFCGVFDGHGQLGHLVAKCVRDSLPSLLAKALVDLSGVTTEGSDLHAIATSGSTRDGTGREDAEQEERGGGNNAVVGRGREWLESMWREAHLSAYAAMDDKLQNHQRINCVCSGTTSVTLIKMGRHLFASNVGDSRCIIARHSASGKLEALQLTVDDSPGIPAEAARIRSCRGRVFAMRDEPDTQRVWLPHDDSPGLAMSRAFGDLCLKAYGLISEPTFYYHECTGTDVFAILATDGVWDVLSNQEAVDVVRNSPRDQAARAVVEKAHSAWKAKLPGSKLDDCTAVCLFIDTPCATEQGPVTPPETGTQAVSACSDESSAPRTGADTLARQSNVALVSPPGTARAVVNGTVLAPPRPDPSSQQSSKADLTSASEASTPWDWSLHPDSGPSSSSPVHSQPKEEASRPVVENGGNLVHQAQLAESPDKGSVLPDVETAKQGANGPPADDPTAEYDARGEVAASALLPGKHLRRGTLVLDGDR